MPDIRHGVGARQDARANEMRDPTRTEQGDHGSSPPPRSVPSAPDLLIGRVINGRFRIISLIARGGMGKVYRAEQAPLGRICALKVLNPNYDGDSDPEFHRRFFLEAATAAKLTHPNTVTVFDYGKADDDDLYYIAMEYIEGKTLHRVLRESGPFSESRTAHVARQICRSLREAHSLGVVHRDLKPANILLVDHGDERDNVKVLDFGLVKDVSGRSTEDLTQAGLFMGSPKYMAPEQIVGSGITPATDIYSLGVMLYEMLSGKVPFDKGKSVVTLMAHVNELPPPISLHNPGVTLSPVMAAIVARCLEKDPSKRFASMNDLLNALKRAGGDEWMSQTNEALPMAAADIAPGPSSSGPRPLVIGGSGVTPLDGVHGAPSGPLSVSGSMPAFLPQGQSGGGVYASPSVTDMGAGQSLTRSGENPFAPKSRKTLVGAIVALVVVGIAGAAMFSIRGAVKTQAHAVDTKPTEVAAPPAVVPPPAATPSAAPPAVAAQDRKVHVESDPPGASVSEDGKELCPATPCDIVWKGDDAKATHKLTFAKFGYQPDAKKVAPTDEKVAGKLGLVLPANTPPVKTATTPAVPPPAKNGNPNDYKPSPY